MCNSIIEQNHIQLNGNEEKNNICRGSNGLVRTGTYQNQPVAIKNFHYLENLRMHGLEKNHALLDQIEEEIRKELTVTINNSYIIQCHGMVFDDFTPKALVMELGDQTLEQCIENYELYDLMTYSWQYIQWIEYMHSMDILHRDIKPSNVIIVNNVAKISYFGEPKQLACSLNIPMQGTLMYRAPEVILGEKYEYKADI
eukprot:TRINITY_DN1764_c0_g2_i1.p1 TRINITY_DN1764_c0_g2~~TRINITY_DN1764_c0_g2_i1.p1  ORF type:complete len:199 (-),score=40.05 TRINITY_DN1764_c0_g2_i1:388-984(-)